MDLRRYRTHNDKKTLKLIEKQTFAYVLSN